MDKKIYSYMNFIHKCKICKQRFSIWCVSNAEWNQSGFNRASGALCKQCFEERVPNPHYLTMEEYIQRRKKEDESLDVEKLREILNEIWNLESEFSPEFRDYELGRSKKT